MPNRQYPAQEMAKPGSFNASTGRISLTVADFKNMVAAFNDLKGKYMFPLKLGHNDGQKLLKNDGLPAAGWIANLRLDGDTLISDFVDVPEGVAKLIDAKALRAKSIEYMRNVTVAGKRYPIVLIGCALLGENLPAVDSLNDIADLYTAASLQAPDFEGEAVEVLAASTTSLTDEEAISAVVAELLAVLEKANDKIHGKAGAPAVRSLVATTLRQLKSVASGTYRKESLQMDKVLELLKLKEGATEDEILAAINALSSASNKPDNKPESNSDVEALKAELLATQKQVIALSEGQLMQSATTIVNEAIESGKFLPASRDILVKMATGNLDSFKELVEKTPAKSALALGEKGSTNDGAAVTTVGGFDASKFELTEGDKLAANALGISETDMIRQKATNAGVTVPDDFGKETGISDSAVKKLATEIATAIKAEKAS